MSITISPFSLFVKHLLLLFWITCVLCWSDSPLRLREHVSDDLLPVFRFPEFDNLPLHQRGDRVPSFTVPTLSGEYTYDSVGQGEATPVVLFAWDKRSAFQNAMWHNNHYLKELFIESAENIHYVFMSYEHAEQSAKYMKQRCQTAMELLNYTSSQIDQWNSRLHFVTEPVSKLDSSDSFIPSVLHQWTGSLTWLNATSSDPTVKLPENPLVRLDARWPWSPSMTSVFSNNILPLAWFGDGCVDNSNLPPRQNVSGKIALIAKNDLVCSYANKIIAAELVGAVGAIVYADRGDVLVDMFGTLYPSIPSTMIHNQVGSTLASLLTSNQPISVEFYNEITSGFWFAIDSNSELQECGYIMFPSFQFLGYIAQYLHFQQNLQREIERNPAKYEVVLFNQTKMNGPVNASVEFPIPPSEMSKYSLELDMSLNCYGKNDVSCPIWDRTLQLLVDCKTPDGFQEIGRWITPFKRGAGRWVTNITSLIPLLSQPQCTFQFAINASGGGVDDPWRPSATLRFSQSAANSIGPTSIIPLFNGGTFSSTYNDAYQPITFIPPQGTQKIELTAIITGHGCATDCCCEFCPTTHVFEFNQSDNLSISKTFYNAGTPIGCARRVPSGVEPNEYGTWLYGRDGWCDGRNVFPWITDVTSLIDLKTSNQVQYYALQGGKPPNQGGYIIMYSYLTFYSSI